MERLRFTQTTGTWDDASTFCPSPRSCNFPNDLVSQRRDAPGIGNQPGDPISRSYTLPESLPSTQPAAAQLSDLTRAQQVALARKLRDSVILDAAGEAFSKIGYDPSRYTSSQACTSKRPSMEAQQRGRRPVETQTTAADDSFYDSFRWMDKDDDLDLNLYLDNDHDAHHGGDYQADSAEIESTSPPQEDYRPSFRRHLSINMMPFARTSFSSSRPGTKAGRQTPAPPTPTSLSFPSHTRRRSRAISLMNARQSSQGSTHCIDAAAAHYQDPEARLKLRVYLASAQKFDEAVEFGFPSSASTEVLSTARPERLEYMSRRNRSQNILSDDSSNLKTFFSDDQSSTNGDDLSLPDPDSPRTPHSPDKFSRHQSAFDSEDGRCSKLSGVYTHAPSASREMTLRMTLTRSDLRAGEEQIYGWQKGLQPPTRSARPSMSVRPSTAHDESPARPIYYGAGDKPRENMDRFFDNLDDEEEVVGTDRGVVKRLWNKMWRS